MNGTTQSHSYYTWAMPKNAGWNSPSFFPIGPWMMSLVTQADADAVLGVGWNTVWGAAGNTVPFVALQNRIWLTQLVENTDTVLPGTGNETVGLDSYDEPPSYADGVTGPISSTSLVHQSGRVWTMGLTWNWLVYGGLSGAPPPGTNYSILSTAVPAPGGTKRRINVSGADLFFFAGARSQATNYQCGLMEFANPNVPCTIAQAARGSNYGDMISTQATLQAPYNAPILCNIEDGGPYTADTQASFYIYPSEMNWAVWSSLIHGCGGIIYFDHTFAGPAQSDANIEQPYYQAAQPPAVVSITTQLNNTDALVKQMAPQLNAPYARGYVTVSPPGWTLDGGVANQSGGIEVAAKWYNGQFYLFTDTRYPEGTNNTVAQFTLNDPTATSVTVINESRSLPVTAGAFTDTFAHAQTVHIYQVVH